MITGIPARPGLGERRRGGIEQAGDQRQQQTDARPEVERVDGDEREEEHVEEAISAAGQIEQKEDEQEVDAQRADEDGSRRARLDGDESEDAGLVRREPHHERVGVHLATGLERVETEGDETADHDEGQEHGEDALVALEQPENRGPWPARGRHHVSTLSVDRRAPAVPARRLLVGVAGAKHGGLVEGAPDDLKGQGETVPGEAAGQGEGREPEPVEGAREPGEAPLALGDLRGGALRGVGERRRGLGDDRRHEDVGLREHLDG